MSNRKYFDDMTDDEKILALRVIIESFDINWDSYVKSSRIHRNSTMPPIDPRADDNHFILKSLQFADSLHEAIDSISVWSYVEKDLGLPSCTISRAYDLAAKDCRIAGHVCKLQIDISHIFRT